LTSVATIADFFDSQVQIMLKKHYLLCACLKMSHRHNQLNMEINVQTYF
jgi:hypothetical protein